MKLLRFAVLSIGILLRTFSLSAQIQGPSQLDGIYQTNCASCHGKNMEGGSGPSLTDTINVRALTDDVIMRKIREGAPNNGMPAWGAIFSDKEARLLVLYIREAAARRAKAGAVATTTLKPGVVKSRLHSVGIEIWTDELIEPWGLAFLPNGSALVTEKRGKLWRLSSNGKTRTLILGTPTDLDLRNQAGLFDVVLHPDFGHSAWVYLSYAHLKKDPAGKDVSLTKIVRGKIVGDKWTDEEPIFIGEDAAYAPAGHSNFGGRMFFAKDGYLYFTIGDCRRAENAQRRDLPTGKVHRLTADGRVPQNNPFRHEGGTLGSIYTWGHRNSQGITQDPRTKDIFICEHGPRGGDEVNLLRPGSNYGWPLATYGMEYDGTSISAHTHLTGTEQPLIHWEPSIAPSGLLFYHHSRFSHWRGHLLLGSLAAEELHLLTLVHGSVIKDELVLSRTGRIRQVISDSHGYVYLLLPTRIVRLYNATDEWRQISTEGPSKKFSD